LGFNPLGYLLTPDPQSSLLGPLAVEPVFMVGPHHSYGEAAVSDSYPAIIKAIE